MMRWTSCIRSSSLLCNSSLNCATSLALDASRLAFSALNASISLRRNSSSEASCARSDSFSCLFDSSAACDRESSDFDCTLNVESSFANWRLRSSASCFSCRRVSDSVSALASFSFSESTSLLRFSISFLCLIFCSSNVIRCPFSSSTSALAPLSSLSAFSLLLSDSLSSLSTLSTRNCISLCCSNAAVVLSNFCLSSRIAFESSSLRDRRSECSS
mmetsp:Transcript_17544/g.28816  ORF Transcript_17544/g.28816 Transcript_17544/m.28816 type:complete len:216 (-) Transcript_17544:2203-2850(-)